jgi:hypothetical protein
VLPLEMAGLPLLEVAVIQRRDWRRNNSGNRQWRAPEHWDWEGRSA